MEPSTRACSPAETVTHASAPAALVIGHPGHELRVFGWSARQVPRVFVLTDGGGAGERPRLARTDALLATLGATREPSFPVRSDRQMYEQLMAADVAPFADLAERLADAFIAQGIATVAGDAAEGFNPTHDLCRGLVNAAVAIAEARSRRPIANYEFELTEWERGGAAAHDAGCVHEVLPENMFRRKLEAARGYAELRCDVDRALAAHGEGYFQLECMRPARALTEPREPPYYELVGADRVRQGVYREALHYADHVRPILDGLRAYAERGRQCSAA